MAEYDYDLFVIGAGSGGVRAARVAAIAGAKVAVVEEHRVGGTCVIRGCVPKKFMVYASEFSHYFKTAEGYGWTIGETSFDWPAFIAEKDKEIARLSGIYVRNLQNAGAELFHGKGLVIDPQCQASPARTGASLAPAMRSPAQVSLPSPALRQPAASAGTSNWRRRRRAADAVRGKAGAAACAMLPKPNPASGNPASQPRMPRRAMVIAGPARRVQARA